MKIEYSHDLSAADYNRLRHSAGWADLTLEQAETGLSNSAYIISARREGEVVGMARYLSDGGYIRFIADVVVLPEYQGLGIGRYMVEDMLQDIQKKKKANEYISINLMAAKGKETFYEKFGFAVRPSDRSGAGLTLNLERAI